MQYVLLIYIDDERWGALPKPEQDRIRHESGTWAAEVDKSGHGRGHYGLHPTATATTLREKNGKRVFTDGPFAETKEVLGGFSIVECKDLDEAIAIAGRFPALRAGSLEVRPMDTG